MNTIADKTDAELKNDVLAELKYEPGVDVSDIGVLVKEGAVTLNGFVTNYGEKWNAVSATKRVAGVRAIADDIVVKLANTLVRSDGEIAAAAANHISWFFSIPKDAVKILVRDGWLTLEGELEWGYQRTDVEDSLQFLTGVKGITNLITIKPRLAVANIEDAIVTAFERNSLLDAEKIQVEITGHNVTLRGKVRNYAEYDEAERIAWAAPGVWSVANKIDVKWFWAYEN